jgi:hypothetical protein
MSNRHTAAASALFVGKYTCGCGKPVKVMRRVIEEQVQVRVGTLERDGAWVGGYIARPSAPPRFFAPMEEQKHIYVGCGDDECDHYVKVSITMFAGWEDT